MGKANTKTQLKTFPKALSSHFNIPCFISRYHDIVQIDSRCLQYTLKSSHIPSSIFTSQTPKMKLKTVLQPLSIFQSLVIMFPITPLEVLNHVKVGV